MPSHLWKDHDTVMYRKHENISFSELLNYNLQDRPHPEVFFFGPFVKV